MRELQRAYDNAISKLKQNLVADAKKAAGVSRRDTDSVKARPAMAFSERPWPA